MASWARYAEGVDEQREPIEVVDQLADTLRMTKSTLGHFMEIVGRLNNEKDFQRLLPELLRSTIRVSQV